MRRDSIIGIILIFKKKEGALVNYFCDNLIACLFLAQK
jgi:hypothetical protein